MALFDLLGGIIEGRPFLDLFAGSGAVGFEALSRGASPVAFVESSPVAVRMIGEAAARFRVPTEDVLAIRGDALDPAAWVSSLQAPAEVAFVGTPYRLLASPGGPPRLARALVEMRARGGLATGARVVVQEEGRGGVTPEALGTGWAPDPALTRAYGRTRLEGWRSG